MQPAGTAMAKTNPDLSKELQESIKKLLNKQDIQLQQRVKLETKPKKYEDRILVLTTWRIYILIVKIPTKIESSFNVLEIRTLNALSKNQIFIETEKAHCSLKLNSTESVDQVTSYVNFALSKIFPSPSTVCSIRRRNPETPESTRNPSPNSETSTSTTHSVCGGFSETYAALCDYNGMCCREEVQWDVDTIYHSQDNREFNLLDFSHLECRDLALIVASLAYNQWFTKLYCKDLKLGSEVIDQVLHTISKTSSLEEIVLENCGLKSDFAQKLASVFGENPNTTLHSINLSHNQLEDKGVFSLSQQLLYFPKGLKHLNLSKTSITAKGLGYLCQAIGGNPGFASSLLHLDLSKNSGLLATDEANALYSFLAQPNTLVHLDLSGTDCAVDTLFGALLHGCCTHLTYLNLTRNAFSHKKGKDALPSFRQFFSSTFSLAHVSLSGIKLPLDALRALFYGLSTNTHVSDLHLDLSSCDLRAAGAQILQEQFSAVSAVGSLDVSDNGFDSDMITLVPALGKNKSLKHLFIGKNFCVKSRTLEEILQRIVHLIQEEDCSLESLSVADSRLKSRTSILINALGSNTCLTKVDISGNSMEDIGAKMLSKALQINSTLRSITWDRNSTSALGFLDIARALQNNYSLKFMSFPISDISQAYKNSPDKTEEAWQKIQWSLLRNNHSQTFSQQQVFRLHQGIVTSSAEQMMDRLYVKVQEEIRALRSCPVESVQDDVLYARQLMKDAKNSRALFPSLCELGHILASDGPVRHRLESVATEVSKAVDKELQVILESMVDLTQELCPNGMRAAENHNKMLSAVSDRVTVPRNFIRSVLLEQAGLDIQNKLNEVKLSVVTYLTNSIVDEVLQELYHSHKKLSRHIVELRKLAQQEAEILGMLQELPPKKILRENEEFTDDELSTSIDTIAIKRQLHSRKIRPVSAFISVSEQELDRHAMEMESPSGWFSSSTSSQYSRSRSTSFEALVDLPTEGAKLEHHTRGRPRPQRNIRQTSSKRNLRVPVVETPKQENGTVTRLDEGLEDFFRKKVIAESLSLSQPAAGKMSTADAPQQKKRRRGLFHFRKHRHPKVEKDADTEGKDPSHPMTVPDEELLSQQTTPEEEGQRERQDVPLIPGVQIPGRGGVKGLPCRVKKTYDHPPDSEVPEEKLKLMQPARVQGIALPGMGGSRGQSFDCKKENLDMEEAAGHHVQERRRSSADSGKGSWKPQPPPSTLKPNFSTSRRSEVGWQIAEEVSRDQGGGKEMAERRLQGDIREKGKDEDDKHAIILPSPGSGSIKDHDTSPNSHLPGVRPVAAPRGRKSSADMAHEEPENGRSHISANCLGAREMQSSTPVAKPRQKLETSRGMETSSEELAVGNNDSNGAVKAPPLKPQRSRRAQSCDKLDSGRSPESDSGGNDRDSKAQLPESSERKVPQRRLAMSLRFKPTDRSSGEPLRARKSPQSPA